MTLYYGFVDGASRHTLNLASATWVLYSQFGDLVSLGEVFLGPATNNIVEYHAMIGLLNEASSHEISHLVVFLDYELMVSQLNHA